MLALLLASPLGTADEHTCYTTSRPEGDVTAANGTRFYVELALYSPIIDASYDPLWGLLVFEETNGYDGLQRETQRHTDVAECGGTIPGDTLVADASSPISR